jgi:hypothetical protein
MRAFAVFLLLILADCVATAADVVATLTPPSARIGDTLHLDLRLNGAAGRAVQFPKIGNDTIAVLKVDSSRLASQATIGYTLAIYDTGRFALSNLPVVVGRGADAETLYATPVTVSIQSVVSDSAKDIRPLKPYREHPFQLRELLDWWWVAALIAFGVLVWWIWRKYFSRKAQEEAAAAIPLLPPHDEAIRNLIALKDKGYPARGMLKEFYSEYSLIMRRYLERRYEFPALEMTTFDLARELEDEDLPQVLTERLLPVLREADLVKFAKFVPDYRECDAQIDRGFELVELTRAHPELEVVEEKAA